MMMLPSILLPILLLATTYTTTTLAFSPVYTRSTFRKHTQQLYALKYKYSDIATVGYAIQVSKPLGVVFGENEDPFFGLVVDDVDSEQNGGKAGIRIGDQLLAINGKPVVGSTFDAVMSDLVAADGALELQMYRGSIRSLYVILLNKKETASSDSDAVDEQDNDYDDDDDDIVVMDENYESPVQIDVSQFEDKPLTPGDFLKAFKKVGSMLTEGDGAETKAQQSKPKGGLFGLFGGEKQEDFFLDDDDASSLKRGGKSK